MAEYERKSKPKLARTKVKAKHYHKPNPIDNIQKSDTRQQRADKQKASTKSKLNVKRPVIKY